MHTQDESDSSWDGSDDETSKDGRSKKKRKRETNGDNEKDVAAAEAANSKDGGNKKRKCETNGGSMKDANNEKDVGAAEAANSNVANSKDVGKNKMKRKTNGGSSSDDDDDDDTEDEDCVDITLDKELLKNDTVRALESDPEYQNLKKLTAKARQEQGKQKRFRDLREPIRSAASAAREAYIRAARAQPDTPDVKTMIKVI